MTEEEQLAMAVKMSNAEEEGDNEEMLFVHIKNSGFPLEKSRETVTDGNCLWDAVADQVALQGGIPGVPHTHEGLRALVSNHLFFLFCILSSWFFWMICM